METMETSSSVEVYWSYDNIKKGCNRKFLLHQDLVRCVHRKTRSLTTVVDTVIGYTKAVMSTLLSIERSIFYAHPCFQGEEWYEWAMVHFEQMDNDGDMIENIYLSWILGFISINNDHEAVIQCSLKPGHHEVHTYPSPLNALEQCSSYSPNLCDIGGKHCTQKQDHHSILMR
jgi:hypothetical protein